MNKIQNNKVVLHNELINKFTYLGSNSSLADDYGSSAGTKYPYPAKLPTFLAKLGLVELKRWDIVKKETYQSLNNSPLNYNKYAWSLMKDDEFLKRHKAIMKTIHKLETKYG